MEGLGHVDAFNDPLIDNKDSKKRYRADVLIEDHIGKIEAKIAKDVAKAEKRFGDAFDKAQFLATNGNCVRRQGEIDDINARFKAAMEADDLDAVKQLILDLGIKDPETGSANWTDVRQFNLMFKTELGAVSGDAGVIYLRPETAQGIFVNFLNVQKSGRMKLPFGIAQIGKAFRNEIIARQFIFRMREFEQMEMQFFVAPGHPRRVVRVLEGGPDPMAQGPRIGRRRVPVPRPRQAGPLRGRRLRHRIQFPHGLQGARRHPQPDGLRPRRPRGAQRQEAAVLRPRKGGELRALRGGDLHRPRPHVPRRPVQRLARGDARGRLRAHGDAHSGRLGPGQARGVAPIKKDGLPEKARARS